MNDNETRRNQMFVRVRDFGQTHTDFDPTSLARQHFTDLGTAIRQLDTHAADEASGRGEARQATESRAQARAELREDLAVLAEWTSASHTERAPRRAAAAGGATPLPPPSQGSTPPPPPSA